jgi:hypothetical protein
VSRCGEPARLTAAAEEGGATLLVSGVDPGWGNDALAVIAAVLCTRIKSIHCQEIFDYSTYNQPYAVKVSCGFGGTMDEVPMMLLPTVPTMVLGRKHPVDRQAPGPGNWRSWLAEQKPGIYDGLDVPLQPSLPPEVEAQRWSDQT